MLLVQSENTEKHKEFLSWQDLHRLTQDDDSHVRWRAADAVGSAFSLISDFLLNPYILNLKKSMTLAFILAFFLILFTSILVSGNNNNNSSSNISYEFLDIIAKKINFQNILIPILIPIIVFIAGIFFTRHRESIKLKQFYAVRTYAKKLKQENFKIPEYDPYYLIKPSHDEIINQIQKSNKKILIKGMSGLGKTRMVFEVIKELEKNDKYFVVMPLEQGIELPIWVPKDLFFFKRKFILVFDDLDKYIKNKINVEGIISEFEKNSNYIIVIATCRDEEFEILKKKRVVEDLNFKLIEQGSWSHEEGISLANTLKKEFNQEKFDGTPGSIVLDYPLKAIYYDRFTKSEKNILRSIKLLELSNIFFPQIELVKNVYENVFESHEDFYTDFNNLKTNKFVYLAKNIVYCPYYYLLHVVTDYPLGNQLFLEMRALRKVFSELESYKNLFNLGNAFYFKEKYQDAVECYEKVIEIKPDYADAWYNKGVAFGNFDQYEEALKAFDKAIELKPDYADAWSNKGVAFGNLDQYEEALKAYDKAIELKSDHAYAWYNKGLAFGNLDQYEEELKAYDKAIELKPDYADAWYNRACHYCSIKGDKEKAFSDLKNAIELDISFKETAKKDKNFEKLSYDEDFKKLVK